MARTYTPTVFIYTDGSCYHKDGTGAAAAILISGGLRKELSQGFCNTTVGRMEIMGVILGLSALKIPATVMLYCDSQYVVNSIEKGWAKRWQKMGWKHGDGKRKNFDLWERVLELGQRHIIYAKWVRGHNSNIENERCDELADLARRSGNHVDDKQPCEALATL